MKIKSKSVFRPYAIAYLFLSMGFLAVILNPIDAVLVGVQDTKTLMICWVLLYCLTVGFLVSFKKYHYKELYLLLVPIVFFMSSIWSGLPSQTFSYSIALIFNCLFALVFVRAIPKDRFVPFLGGVIFFYCLLGMLAYFVGLEITQHYDVHERESLIGLVPFRGFFNHKITAGLGAVLGIHCFLYSNVKFKYLYVLFFMLVILLSGSSLAITVLLFSIAASPVLFKVGKYKFGGFQLFLLVIVGSALMVMCYFLFGAMLLELLGRDLTLTGRTTLWLWAMEIIAEKPVLGWGYKAYFGTEQAGIFADSFVKFQNYDVPHFHNAFFQAAVDAGIFALLIILMSVFYVFGYCGRQIVAFKNRMHTSGKSLLMINFSIFFSSMFSYQMYQYNNFLSLVFLISFAYALRESNLIHSD